jgi:hypothetical protein
VKIYDPNEGQPKFSSLSDAIVTVGALTIVGLLISVFYASYNGQAFTDVISFRVGDGWCDSQTEGVGLHCFGDFGTNRTADFTEATYNSLLAQNTPLVNLFFGVYRSIPYQLGLTIYLFTMFIGIAGSVWSATKGMVLSSRTMLVLFIGILNVGTFSTLDRGNHVGWMVPLAFWFLSAVYKSNWTHASIALSLLVSVKWWGVLFALGLVVYHKWGHLFRSALLAIVMNHLALGFFAGSYHFKVSSIYEWLFDRDLTAQVATYSVSASTFFVRMSCFLQQSDYCNFVSGHQGAASGSDADGATSAPLARFVLVIVICALLYWIGRRLTKTPELFLSLLPLLSIVVLPEAGIYNISLIGSGLATLVQSENSRGNRENLTDEFRVKRTITVLMLLMIAPVGYYYRNPGSLNGLTSDGYVLRIQYITVPVLALTCLLVTLTFALRHHTSGSTKQIAPG